MPLIYWEVNLIMTCSEKCVIIYTDVANQTLTFTITETNLSIPVVTLLTQDNAKLLLQLKLRVKSTISWNKYLLRPGRFISTKLKLKSLSCTKSHGVNRRFVLGCEDDAQRASNKRYYIPIIWKY